MLTSLSQVKPSKSKSNQKPPVFVTAKNGGQSYFKRLANRYETRRQARVFPKKTDYSEGLIPVVHASRAVPCTALEKYQSNH
jgi:hypothetical protein